MTTTTSNGPRMRRAKTMARGRKQWADILAWLSKRQQRDLMVRAAQQQQQPLAAVVAGLLGQFGAALGEKGTKLFVGTAIAGIMEEEGFDVAATGDRMPASAVGPFRSAARYARSPAAAEGWEGDDILATMLAALDADQRRRLAQMIGE
jgi:hypothetical protein